MRAAPDLHGVLRLSVAERIQFVSDVWDSIAADQDSVPVPGEHVEILEERLQARKKRKSPGRPWNEVKKRILQGRQA